MSIIGMLLVLAVAAFFVTVFLKLSPYYFEYYTVRSVMDNLAEDPAAQNMSRRTVLTTVDKRLYTNYVERVTKDHFSFKPLSRGYELRLNYEVREHLFANVEVVLSFAHQVAFAGE
ncbi:MAG: DUF4845 domain-containing protein [Pseudomonadota bacterium]|nr:DUF4845 domain-containing protein [Pseudomonadota bacterium]